MKANLLFTHALTPLHAGTGQGVGVIDLPIARETATGLPLVPGSTVKGVLRDRCRKNAATQTLVAPIFGPDTANASDYAGSARFSDQRLLLFPVRTLKGTFAWVTSPFILNRLVRDCKQVGVDDCPAVPRPETEQSILATPDNVLTVTLTRQGKAKIVLEDLDLEPTELDEVQEWATWIGKRIFTNDQAWKDILQEHLCLVHDDVLTFLLETSTQITARIRLQEESKTVVDGGLWYEEALPAETVLYGLVAATPVDATNLPVDDIFSTIQTLIAQMIQLGGSATVGRGMCQLSMNEAEEEIAEETTNDNA
ncbi:MAG: type III-B CRISPR module RAMP protein Cmr4 [Chloroflexota bacterium]